MIEIRTFHLATGVDEEAFLAADKKLQTDFAYQQPGLLRRTAARGDDGEWVVVDLWRGAVEADAAEAKFARDPVAREYASFVDPASLVTRRFHELD